MMCFCGQDSLVRELNGKAERLSSQDPQEVNHSSTDSCPVKLSLSEIRRATRGFNYEFIISQKHSVWNLYKGTLRNGVKVAVKRFAVGKFEKFVEEFDFMSQISHPNIVNLIGLYDEWKRPMLIYEYTESVNLADYLLPSWERKSELFPFQPELSWERRLQICVHSAEALHYLHAGCSSKIIHGNFRSSNIFFNVNYNAKIAYSTGWESDFFDIDDGRTEKKASFGYLDPEFIMSTTYSSSKLTEKSDVYAFGVVLLEVLCGRLAFRMVREGGKLWSLTDWGIHMLKKGEIRRIIDPVLVGKIEPRSLEVFAQTAEKCLNCKGEGRPVMREVMWSLEFALELQRCWESKKVA